MFGLDEKIAIRYATAARAQLHTPSNVTPRVQPEPLPVLPARHSERTMAFVMNRSVPACLSALALTLTACTGTPTSSSTRTSTTPTPPTATTPHRPSSLGRPDCDPPSPISRTGFPEVQGTSSQVQLWGLIMATGPDNPLRVNEQVKIVWRITGSGDLHLSSIGPNGRPHPLLWGPDPHLLGSSYQRPGEEWGAGYLFTQPGCWTLHATRGVATADVWLEIAP